eukprot:TRINITY_DN10978_c0_g1_i2.p1 TRINITY_DN10978_c0_g1~~TRINITY_DN10978_c0_g1_i2.p1  ORF type:complete len:174 (-),score=25.67 TRINITY_DN10978_c0_g1_i2:22-543(-)
MRMGISVCPFEDDFKVKGIMDEDRSAASIAYSVQKRADLSTPRPCLQVPGHRDDLLPLWGPLIIYLIAEDGESWRGLLLVWMWLMEKFWHFLSQRTAGSRVWLKAARKMLTLSSAAPWLQDLMPGTLRLRLWKLSGGIIYSEIQIWILGKTSEFMIKRFLSKYDELHDLNKSM